MSEPASAASSGTQRPAQHTTTSAGMTWPAAVRTARTTPSATSRPVTWPGAPVSTVAPCRAARAASSATIGSVSR